MPSFEQLNRRYGPWVSLALGVAAVVYMRRGLGFAPVAVGVLMLAWIGAAALRRLAPVIVPADASGALIADVPRWRRLVVPAAGSLVVGLWQNVLFYLLPLWWASTVPGSWNVALPAVLAAMALLSCFEHRWRAWVLDRPIVHAAWSAVVLFATLVPVGAADSFPAGTERVYAWFAVAVPARYRQPVRFEWYRDGAPVGRVIETFVVGGRREGFRTWSSRAAPAPGRWRVDLHTDSSQLIARESFVVR